MPCRFVDLPQTFEVTLFAHLCRTLDFATAAALARTSQRFSDAWRWYALVVDLPYRLQRFYRGVALRNCVAIIFDDARVYRAAVEQQNVEIMRLPTLDNAQRQQSATDADCLLETIVFGLPTRREDLEAFVELGLLEQSSLERMARVQSVVSRRPHTVPSTRASFLAPSCRWVVSVWKSLELTSNDAIDILAGRRSPVDAEQTTFDGNISLVHGERVSAHAAVVANICGVEFDTSTPIAFNRLPQHIIDFQRQCSVAQVSKDPLIKVSMFELYRAMLAAAFGFRRRRSGLGAMATARPGHVPAYVDANSAWMFEAYNGLVDNDAARRDELAAAPLWRRLHGGRSFELSASCLRGHYETARRYMEMRVVEPPRTKIDTVDWLTTVVSKEADATLRALRTAVADSRRMALKQRRSAHGGVVLRVSPTLALPSPLYIDYSQHENAIVIATPSLSATMPRGSHVVTYVHDMMASSPLMLAKINYSSHFDQFIVRWQTVAMRLDASGRTVRCRLLEAFNIGGFQHQRPQPLPHASSSPAWHAIPRCRVCSRVLVDPESIVSGFGPRCRAKMVERECLRVFSVKTG